MLPRALRQLSSHLEGERILPHYLSVRDEPWLRALLDEYARFVGEKRSALREHLQEPLPTPAPKSKLRLAIHVLDTLGRDRTRACVPPRTGRRVVFVAASQGAGAREAVLREAAVTLGVAADELEAALFADLRGERHVGKLPKDLSPSHLALQVNLAIVTSFLRRAAHVRITASGNTRALVRHARLLGLICVASRASSNHEGALPNPRELDSMPEEATDGVVLDMSGPFALFRRTELYGKALASLVPRAAWCNRFRIEAWCALGAGKQLSTLIVNSGDPIGPGRELNRYDSKLEQRFAEEFRCAAPEWDVIREPRPVEAEGTLVFPDFELIHRRDPARRWLLEIVGFWTREYLTEKLRRLSSAALERLVLCIDRRRCCSEEEIPPHARVIRYSSRVDPRDVLKIVDPVS